MEFLKQLNILCGEKGVSVSKALESIGLSRSAITSWRKGSKPTPQTLQKLANYFSKDVSVFYDEPEPKYVYPVQSAIMMPIIGTVRAGYGGIAEEEFTGEYRMVTDINGYDPSECRLLNVSGDSMYPLLMEGDTVLVHIQPEVDNGQVAVIINDDEATMKRVKIGNGEITLIPENREYKTRTIKGEELRPVRIYGRVLSVVQEAGSSNLLTQTNKSLEKSRLFACS